VLVPDERGNSGVSVICCYRGFRTNHGCLAAHAPGLSGG
jgi:hypothetical protein